jgi:hypothetical protein
MPKGAQDALSELHSRIASLEQSLLARH